MAANPKILLDNSPDKLSKSDNIYSQINDDLEIKKSDIYIDNTFNLDLFNKKYEDIRKKKQKIVKDTEQKRLSKLNITEFTKKIHEYTVGELLFKLKDSIFGILGDLLRFRFRLDTFTKNNRLFYLGLLILIIILIIYLFSKNIESENKTCIYNSKYNSMFGDKINDNIILELDNIKNDVNNIYHDLQINPMYIKK